MDMQDPNRIDPSRYDDHSTEAAFHASNARLNDSIKDANARGVKTGVESQHVGQIIPPPPSFDPFNGKTCMGPGLKKNGFGNPKVCGRQAVSVLRTISPEVPEKISLESRAAEMHARFAMQAYGGTNARIPAGGGPMVGHQVPDPLAPPGADEDYRCFYHGVTAHKNDLHPDDNGGFIPPVGPEPEKPIFGLEHLDSTRPFRAVGQDASYVWVTDGKVTVMAHKRDYIDLLAKYNLLPSETTTQLLP